MATARDIITRALRKTKSYSGGEVVAAQDADDALEALNHMLAEWEIDGIDLAHIELALADTLDVPDNHLNAVVLNLAQRVCEEFGGAITQQLASEAQNGLALLRAYHFTLNDLGSDHPAASG